VLGLKLVSRLFHERDLFAALTIAGVWDRAPKGRESYYRARGIVVFDRTLNQLYATRMNEILKLLTTAPESQTTPELRKHIASWVETVNTGGTVEAKVIVPAMDILGGCTRQVRHLITAYFQEALSRELKTEEKVRAEAGLRTRSSTIAPFNKVRNYEARPDCR